MKIIILLTFLIYSAVSKPLIVKGKDVTCFIDENRWQINPEAMFYNYKYLNDTIINDFTKNHMLQYHLWDCNCKWSIPNTIICNCMIVHTNATEFTYCEGTNPLVIGSLFRGEIFDPNGNWTIDIKFYPLYPFCFIDNLYLQFAGIVSEDTCRMRYQSVNRGTCSSMEC